jgi:succinoglycan biosynthesis transport protein ExoP
VFAEREGELMQVSLKLENGNDARLLVDAVIDAYIADVVDEEKNNRKRTLGQLKSAHKTIMDQVKRDKEDYRDLAKEHGASESEYASVDRELAFAQLHLLRKERENLNMRKMDVELALQLLKVAGNDDARIGAAVSEQMASDPKIQYLQSRQMNIEARLTEERMRAKRQDAPSIQRMLTERQQVAQEIASAQADLRRQAQAAMAGSPNTEYKNMVKGQKLQKKHYEVQITEIDRKFDSVQQQIRELAEENLDLEMRKGDLEERQQVGNDLASQIAGLDIQLGAPARARVYQRATVMDGLDLFQRAVLVGLGGLFGLCATALGIAYLDFRRRPLNGPDQIDDGLGIRVVGSLPPLAFRKASDESDPMLALLMESIDSVRTALMHTDTSQETRVVLVTSALGHEGRSTVASQLAASLARAGRRTLLVDGDVRHPTLHRLFDFPIEDGFCEVLRGDVDVADVVRPTHAESLWLLTAGYCDARAIQALAKDQVQPIFDKLRNEYDFVIIDGAPVLKLSDSLILGQYCDGAILSVLRDVSQVAKVHEANDLLRSVGIRVIGSVVNGVREKPDDRISPLLLATAAATEFAEEEVEAE